MKTLLKNNHNYFIVKRFLKKLFPSEYPSLSAIIFVTTECLAISESFPNKIKLISGKWKCWQLRFCWQNRFSKLDLIENKADKLYFVVPPEIACGSFRLLALLFYFPFCIIFSFLFCFSGIFCHLFCFGPSERAGERKRDRWQQTADRGQRTTDRGQRTADTNSDSYGDN